jgi:hypothetical protein
MQAATPSVQRTGCAITLVLMAFPLLVAGRTLEEFSPRLSASAQVVWNAPTNNLPRSLWVYQRHGPRIFSPAIISNAMVLGSLQGKGIPKPPTKDFFIWEDRGPNYPGPIPALFSIRPAFGTISYCRPWPARGAGTDLPSDTGVVARAWSELRRFGVDPKQVKLKDLTSFFCSEDESGKPVSKRLCGRGAFLSRQLGGISFLGKGDDGSAEGFWIELGSRGELRGFCLNWPDLDQHERHQIASPVQLMECIRKQKVMVLPGDEEGGYFQRLKRLGSARKLAITKITLYYSDGVFGDWPTNDVPSQFVAPCAELETVAEFKDGKATAVFLSPILASDTVRLLKR